MDNVQEIILRVSVTNKALKIQKQRYGHVNDEDLRVGLLGEFAVVEFLRQKSLGVMHNSIAEMQFAPSEGGTDVYYFTDDGVRVNVQVKATKHGTCWIKECSLKTYLATNVNAVYFVDVEIKGYFAHCHIYLRTTPQEIKRSWHLVDRNTRRIHPILHRARRIYK